MSSVIDCNCNGCDHSIILFSSDGETISLTVACVLCETERSISVEDFFTKGRAVPQCCGLQLFPHFWDEGACILAINCPKCLALGEVSLEEGVDRLRDEYGADDVAVELRIFH